MTGANEGTKSISAIIIEEALRRLDVLSWCSLNQQLYDPTETYCITDLLHEKKRALHEVLVEVTGQIDRHPTPASSCSSHTNPIRLSSSSGEERIYYDRFEYLDRCKEIRRLTKRLNVLQFHCHGLNQKLHEESQIEMTKQRFIRSWEKSRSEQLQHTIFDHVANLQKERTEMIRDQTAALQAAAAIDKFYLWKLESTEAQIEEWMNRFDHEKEDQDSRFQKARATEKYWSELKQSFEQQQQEVEALETELARWETVLRHKEFCGRMATRLQAWWRGVMVRKGLGRFSPSHGKKGRQAKGKAKGSNKLKKKK